MLSGIYQQYLNSVHEIPEDGTDVPKHVEVVKGYTFKYAYNMCIRLAL